METEEISKNVSKVLLLPVKTEHKMDQSKRQQELAKHETDP